MDGDEKKIKILKNLRIKAIMKRRIIEEQTNFQITSSLS
jgi:hypothetical protein